ncbi:LADA_0E14048g1_1 [Lachancea dasiensis]|uniref:LADA_0E14048g1_1 n=1 Tax=Lachancea dasiensis TaxID=1072105 RepID=A0A1G4JFU7_9SACH|nr:LADA_0E14048g1_1 [Lachancea dasiensis]
MASWNGDARCMGEQGLDSPEVAALTPPSSTLRKPATPVKRDKTVHPLSPEMSSPIRPPKSRKTSNKQDTPLITTRSSNSQTLEELIDTFTDDKRLLLLRDPTRKPPFSYAMLIGLAILQSEHLRLTLSQIYQWITLHFPFYKLSDYGWQNSIRHNLSLNEAFIKGDKSPDGKGHYWQVKRGCEAKFFKGGQSDDEIRLKLAKLCSSVLAATGTGPQSPPDAADLSRDLFSQTIRETARERRRMKGRKLEEPCQLDISTDEDSDGDEVKGTTFNVASSPSPFDTQREISSNDACVIDEPAETSGGHAFPAHKSQSDCLWNEFSLSFSPVQEVKKYSCSFNTSFDTSPHARTPKLDCSSWAKFGSPEAHPRTKTTASSLDLLKTPQIKSMSATCTPRDPNSVRRWRSPNAFVDDFTRSPILINASRTPMVLTDQSMISDVILDKQLPGHHSQNFFENIRYSSGLFGVDVCSVWKRAVESRQDPSAPGINAKDTARLDKPFQLSHK